ncbi:50S ribosomal protein L20 [Patescibacteria group bacterium]|nr:50S ribosomal protein L20 [Patescibacteria group bacterium]MDE1946891.1 50S ribosomal protein L20 [Patescibacteria group bacterium]MDE2010711.1 50S ribosomal protein L20 [Patescibacteria group bacterium]MDE2232683.1 50S ribosomal protein L20 [Patescibacteria group bacterium]
MSRVKKAVHALKNRRSVLKQAKGFRFRRSKTERAANEALAHAGAYAFAHRRDKKGDFRRLWNVKINAALRPLGLSYSKFIGAAKKKNIALDRKSLAHLAEFNSDAFKRVVKEVK